MASGRWSGGSRPRTEGRIFQLGRSSRALRGVGWCGKGGLGQAAVLRLGGRRRAPTPLRCSVSWPRRGTHCAPCSRSVQTAAPSQTTMRAARAAPRPVLLGASEARPHLPRHAFAEPPWCSLRRPPVVIVAAGSACRDAHATAQPRILKEWAARRPRRDPFAGYEDLRASHSNSTSCAPSHSTLRPSAASCACPSTMRRKWLPASGPILLAKLHAP